MEGHFQNSPKLGSPIDNDDLKYVSGLSTILVATIQEAKDRISQIEYIFCSQLFPNFQSKSKMLQRIYSEARRAADLEWKEKENGILVQIERLKIEMQRTLEDNKSLKLERAKNTMEQEEKTVELLARLESKQLKVDELELKLKQKSKDVDELELELKQKSKEVDEGLELQNKLLQLIQSKASEKINLKGSGLLKFLEECEKEKNSFLEKINGLEENVNELQVDLRGRTSEMTKARDLYQKSLEQIESKTTELLVEKKKRRDVIDAYKKLKSQYNFLCAKFGLTGESTVSQHKLPDSLGHNTNQIISPDLEDKNQDNSITACKNNFEEEKGDKLVQGSTSHSPTLTFPTAAKDPSIVKSEPQVGKKRPASTWRDTRSHQAENGPDPHDDFLDTPLENIRENFNKDPPVPIPKDNNFDSSDDETQDVNSNLNLQKNHMPGPVSGKKVFKFVEPVRKKADRENLIGVECKQCKKFYDAVLCGDESKDGNNTDHNFRCEHHYGVSRHRYRYVPPMTPEGFWNIGFESEI